MHETSSIILKKGWRRDYGKQKEEDLPLREIWEVSIEIKLLGREDDVSMMFWTDMMFSLALGNFAQQRKEWSSVGLNALARQAIFLPTGPHRPG